MKQGLGWWRASIAAAALWIALATGVMFNFLTDSLVRTTHLGESPSGTTFRLVRDWGYFCSSAENSPEGTTRFRRRSIFAGAADIRNAFSDEVVLLSEDREDFARLARLEALANLGLAAAAVQVAALLGAAIAMRRRPGLAVKLTALAYVLVAFSHLAARWQIESVFIDPVFDYPAPPDRTLGWHTIAMAWFVWTAVALAGCTAVLAHMVGSAKRPRIGTRKPSSPQHWPQ